MALFRRKPDADREREVADLRSVITGLRGELGVMRKAQEGPAEWLRRVTTQKVLVHQKNDHTIEGLLVGNWADGITLRSAALLHPGGDPTPMAGEVFIPRDQVALVQFNS